MCNSENENRKDYNAVRINANSNVNPRVPIIENPIGNSRNRNFTAHLCDSPCNSKDLRKLDFHANLSANSEIHTN